MLIKFAKLKVALAKKKQKQIKIRPKRNSIPISFLDQKTTIKIVKLKNK